MAGGGATYVVGATGVVQVVGAAEEVHCEEDCSQVVGCEAAALDQLPWSAAQEVAMVGQAWVSVVAIEAAPQDWAALLPQAWVDWSAPPQAWVWSPHAPALAKVSMERILCRHLRRRAYDSE